MPDVMEILVVRREPLIEKECTTCGRTFRGLGRRRYCGVSCQQRAFYARHAERRRAARRERYRQQQQLSAKGTATMGDLPASSSASRSDPGSPKPTHKDGSA